MKKIMYEVYCINCDHEQQYNEEYQMPDVCPYCGCSLYKSEFIVCDKCGEKVYLNRNINTCNCGEKYTKAGDKLGK